MILILIKQCQNTDRHAGPSKEDALTGNIHSAPTQEGSTSDLIPHTPWKEVRNMNTYCGVQRD